MNIKFPKDLFQTSNYSRVEPETHLELLKEFLKLAVKTTFAQYWMSIKLTNGIILK